MKKNTIKVCLVQPVQSPYWTERLKILAMHNDLDLTLLLERDSFAHRPGWRPEPVDGVYVQVLGSMLSKSIRESDDLGFRIDGVRSIPWRLMAELFRMRPDIAVVCNATQLIFTLPAKWLLGIRIALIVEDTPHATRDLGFLARIVKRLLYRRADCWFAFSDDARLFLEQMGIAKNVMRSSWSVDMHRFERLRTNDRLMMEASDANIKIVIFVGAFIPRKGITQLLAAWKTLPAKVRYSTQLLLVGSGPLLHDLQQTIENNALTEVKLLGQKSYPEVIELLKKSDLFVLPTLEDLFSLTVLEAMASGCPVITTPYNGARELIEMNHTGWLVDPLQTEAFKKILENALSSETDLEAMSRAARCRVEGMDNVLVMNEFAQSLRNLVVK